MQIYDSFADAVDEKYDPSADADQENVDPHSKVVLPEVAFAKLNQLGLLFASPVSQTVGSIVVPFPEGVGQGDVSYQVFGVKRAYARSKGGLRLTKLMSQHPGETFIEARARRRTWGPQFSEEFGAQGYTRARHKTLAPFYDSYALSLLHRGPDITPRQATVSRQIGWHNALYNRRYKVPYSQARASQLTRAELITRADCSGSVAGGCAWAGVLPNVDWRWTNTWSQVNWGELIDGIAYAIPGDVIFYGAPSHEALYLGDGLVWSFGSYPCRILRHDYRHDRHSIRRFLPL